MFKKIFKKQFIFIILAVIIGVILCYFSSEIIMNKGIIKEQNNKLTQEQQFLKDHPFIDVISFTKNNKKVLLVRLSHDEISYLNKYFPADFFNGDIRMKNAKDKDILFWVAYKYEKEISYPVILFPIFKQGYTSFIRSLKIDSIKVKCPEYVKAVYKICKDHGIDLPPLELEENPYNKYLLYGLPSLLVMLLILFFTMKKKKKRVL